MKTYTIMSVVNGQKYVNTFTNKEQANDFYKMLCESGITEIYTKKDERKYLIVKVSFGSNKLYTYLTKKKVDVGEKVLVWTSNGPNILKVIESGEATETELEKICPIEDFVYITEKVVAI